MTEHGAALQTYNQELVKCLEDLKIRRSEVQEIVDKQEGEKMILLKNVKILQDKLHQVNKSLDSYKSLRDNYDQIIKECDGGFKKILESSATLLNLAQHESTKLESEQYKALRLPSMLHE